MFAASKTKTVSSAAANYIEDVFQSWLYAGTGASQSIVNGIDLSTKGGMVWIKDRTNAYNNNLFDTARGTTKLLHSNTTDSTVTDANSLTAFNSNGFTLGSGNTAGNQVNTSADNFVSWTFRKQAKFFDVVTYTGNGSNRTISHNLGSTPGCIIVKRTDTTGDWSVYHRSLGSSFPASANTMFIQLNTTQGENQSSTYWNNTTPTSTAFSVSTNANVNANGGTYVAYLFAHNAGGFGAAGTDNVITCGSYTGNGSTTGPTVTLGYEPQWLLIKDAWSLQNWNLIDNMRGFVVGGTDANLNPNLSNAESTGTFVTPTATGFQINTATGAFNNNGEVYIYIAIRRGPMKTPTSGASVFSATQRTGTGANSTIDAGFITDYLISRGLHASYRLNASNDRLRGALFYLCNNSLSPNASTDPEASGTNTITSYANMTGVNVGSDSVGFCNISTVNYINWMFKRAPSFFDEVCYTGTGSNTTISHNLTVAPEFIVVKRRDGTSVYDWMTGATALGFGNFMYFNTASASAADSTVWNSTAPTASVFSIGTHNNVNTNAGKYVAYLFASCTGVSKIGTFTGNGGTQTINCGFASGARFVMIKKTSAADSWYVWDTTRGMYSGYNPYLAINTNANQVTTADSVNSVSSGFTVIDNATSNINNNGATYLYLAIA